VLADGARSDSDIGDDQSRAAARSGEAALFPIRVDEMGRRRNERGDHAENGNCAVQWSVLPPKVE
jgi:hypothetical protein